MKYFKKLKGKANFLYILPSLPLKKYFHYSRSLHGFKINLYRSVEVLVRIYLKAQGLSPVASAHGQISRCYSLFRHCKPEILCFKHASQFIGSYLCYQLVVQTITSRWLKHFEWWCRFSYLLTLTKIGFWFVEYTMHRKWGFPRRISLVNVPKSAVNYGFAYIY